MPSSATITSFYSFTALTTIRSSEVNTNFSNFRGHLLPVDPSTATAATTMTYDLGSIDHLWRGNFNQYGIMYGNTAGSVPTVPTSTAYALYFKNDGNLYKKDSIGNEASFITAAGNLNIASTTGGFTLTNSNDVVLANISASSSTYNLFTAVGNSGKEITIKKIDSTLNVVTIDANSTETIDGSLTTTLNTQYESIKLISDGSNWNILERKIPSEWSSYTPVFTGFGTATNIEFQSKRVNDSLHIRGKFTSGTSTATEARVSLLLGANAVTSADTTKIASIAMVGTWSRDAFTGLLGLAVLVEPSVGYVTFGLATASVDPISKQNGNGFISSGQKVYLFAEIPISGWKGN